MHLRHTYSLNLSKNLIIFSFCKERGLRSMLLMEVFNTTLRFPGKSKPNIWRLEGSLLWVWLMLISWYRKIHSNYDSWYSKQNELRNAAHCVWGGYPEHNSWRYAVQCMLTSSVRITNQQHCCRKHGIRCEHRTNQRNWVSCSSQALVSMFSYLLCMIAVRVVNGIYNRARVFNTVFQISSLVP